MSDLATTGLFDRAIRRIATVWREMAAGVPRDEDDSIADQMRACLSGRGGEISARNRAAKLAQTYLSLDDPGRIDFLRTLAGFDSDTDAVDLAYQGCRRPPTKPTAPPRRRNCGARWNRRDCGC